MLCLPKRSQHLSCMPTTLTRCNPLLTHQPSQQTSGPAPYLPVPLHPAQSSDMVSACLLTAQKGNQSAWASLQGHGPDCTRGASSIGPASRNCSRNTIATCASMPWLLLPTNQASGGLHSRLPQAAALELEQTGDRATLQASLALSLLPLAVEFGDSGNCYPSYHFLLNCAKNWDI